MYRPSFDVIASACPAGPDAVTQTRASGAPPGPRTSPVTIPWAAGTVFCRCPRTAAGPALAVAGAAIAGVAADVLALIQPVRSLCARIVPLRILQRCTSALEDWIFTYSYRI